MPIKSKGAKMNYSERWNCPYHYSSDITELYSEGRWVSCCNYKHPSGLEYEEGAGLYYCNPKDCPAEKEQK